MELNIPDYELCMLTRAKTRAQTVESRSRDQERTMKKRTKSLRRIEKLKYTQPTKVPRGVSVQRNIPTLAFGGHVPAHSNKMAIKRRKKWEAEAVPLKTMLFGRHPGGEVTF